jgi:hypothetical protein
VLLAGIDFESVAAVDYARFLANFDGIVLALGSTGRSAQIYFHQPCRHLEASTGLCRVHGTADQPEVCIRYNDFTCDYRHAMTRDLHPDHPLMDARRMDWYGRRLSFDAEGELAAWPSRADVLRAFAALPMSRQPMAAPGRGSSSAVWQPVAMGVTAAAPESGEATCDGCAAYCCQVLVFPKGHPSDASQLDFMRYVLGFPSLKVGVSDDGWAVIVHTSCRHLEGGRCSIYGRADRPMRCVSYDARKCTYVGHFGNPRPADMVMVSADQFPALADSVVFDRRGRVVALASVSDLRLRLEAAAERLSDHR